MEECKLLPSGAVWDAYCLRQGVPVGLDWLDLIRSYERDVLVHRSGSRA
jgi:L-rhamnose isomerase